MAALLIFRLLPQGFNNAALRKSIAPLLGLEPSQFTPGRMSYNLRRLRQHGLIERIPHTHRYQVTDFGYHGALVFTRIINRVLTPALASIHDPNPPAPTRLRAAADRLDQEIHRRLEGHNSPPKLDSCVKQNPAQGL